MVQASGCSGFRVCDDTGVFKGERPFRTRQGPKTRQKVLRGKTALVQKKRRRQQRPK